MRVAIAGYGDLTRYICEEFVKAGHVLVILTRSYKPQLESQGVAQAITDYSPSSLRDPLADCEVLISTISDISSAYTNVHRNLILACQESPRCKRFIPAEFVTNIEAYPDEPGFYYAPHEPIREMLRSQTDLEWTLVCIGWLSDYFVPSKHRHIKDIGEFHPMNWAENKIVIPGTGNEPVDFTWARDVARGLASLIEAPRGSWEPYTFMSGERSCWNDATRLAAQKYRPGIPIQHVSLHSVAGMIKTAKDENTELLADYYFSGVTFRSLRDGLCQVAEHPDSIL